MEEKKKGAVVAQTLFAAIDKKQEPLKIVIEVNQPWTVKQGKGSVLTLIQQKTGLEQILESDVFFRELLHTRINIIMLFP